MDKENLQEIDKTKEKAKTLGVPFIDLAGHEVPLEVLREIPEEAVVFYKFVPIAKREKKLEVGMVDPSDLRAREAVRFIGLRSQLEPKIFIITPSDFQNVLKQYRSLRSEVQKALQELDKELQKEKSAIEGPPKKTTEKFILEAPITKIVANILRYAVDGRASDIHIEPEEKEIRVRFRVDGILYTSLILPKDIHAAIVSRVKILSNLKIDETRIPQDGRFYAGIDKKKIDFRVSTLPATSGEKVVLRVLDPTIGLKSLKELGLDGYNFKTVETAIKKPFGMILITGPTGSGKSTTLYGIMNILNQEAVNIVSLEDPVEYYIKGVNQSQIKPEIGYTFASGLRHILRQDPDIIMVGEIRDEETASLAIHAALTGHIVLSTLHTNDAIGVIPRLVDMGVGAFLLPPSLNLAVAQRLIKRLCEKCKKQITASPQITEIIDKELNKLSPEQKKNIKWTKPYKIYQAQGCKFCANKGAKGRIAIFEMILMTAQMEKIIIQKPTETAIAEEAERQGIVTMKQDGILKALQGIISFEAMLKAVEE